MYRHPLIHLSHSSPPDTTVTLEWMSSRHASLSSEGFSQVNPSLQVRDGETESAGDRSVNREDYTRSELECVTRVRVSLISYVFKEHLPFHDP